MKKQIAVLTAGLILAGTLSISAAEIDISGLSVEELLQLRADVDEELMNKNGAVVIGYGKYEAGVDIAPGQYTIKVYFAEGSDLAGLYYSILSDATADTRYDDAYWEWRRQYSAYEEAVEAGRTDVVLPEAPNQSDYFIQRDELIEAPGGSAIVSLKEGQTLALEDWCDNVIVTIEQTGGTGKGLFMD